MTARRADIARTTSETDIRVTLDLDGTGRAEVATGVGFFDHSLSGMLAFLVSYLGHSR